MKRLYVPKNAIDPVTEYRQGLSDATSPENPPTNSTTAPEKPKPKPKPNPKPVAEVLDVEAKVEMAKPAEAKEPPQPANDVWSLLEPHKPAEFDLASISKPAVGSATLSASVSVTGTGGKQSEETKRVRLPSGNTEKRKEDIFSVFGPNVEQPVELDKDRFKSCPQMNRGAVFDQIFAGPSRALHPPTNGVSNGTANIAPSPQPWTAYNPSPYAAFKSNPTPYRAPPTVMKPTTIAKPSTLSPPPSTMGMPQPVSTSGSNKGKVFDDILPQDF